MADAPPSDSQPKDAVQLQLGSKLLQNIIDASGEDSRTILRLENGGGVLNVGELQYHLEVKTEPENKVLYFPNESCHSSHDTLAVIRQKLCLQLASDTTGVPDQDCVPVQQSESLAYREQQLLSSVPPAEKVPVTHGRAPSSRALASKHVSGAQWARSGSPPPWAHRVGQKAVFRPALGTREPTPPAGSLPSPKPSPVTASQSTASAKTAAEQHGDALPHDITPEKGISPSMAQGAPQKPSKGKVAPLVPGRGTPEPRLESEQPSWHAADSTRKAKPEQQVLPHKKSVRSQTGTPEPPSHAQTGQPGQHKSLVPPHMQTGKPPLRPGSGSSREATPSSRGDTPDSTNVSSSGLSSPRTSRDNTPQPGAAGQPLSRPSPLGRPGSGPTLQGPAARTGQHGAPAKRVKKTRKLLGKKGAAKKKAGQGTDERNEMHIPAAGLLGARKGLIYCLVGLISHRRYSTKSLTRAVAEVARRVKDMRNPSSELLREQALKIAEYKSPGMWVLLEKYQKFADELKAEADQAALPNEEPPAISDGATPNPEAPAAKGRPQSTPAAERSHDTFHTKAKPRPLREQKQRTAPLSKPTQRQRPQQGSAAASEQQRRAQLKKREVPVHDKNVEISDTDSEGGRPATKRPAHSDRPAAVAGASRPKPTPSPSPRPAHPLEQTIYDGRQPSEMDAMCSDPTPSASPRPSQAPEQPVHYGRPAEAAHPTPSPSPGPRPAPRPGPAKPGRGSPSPPQPSRPPTPSELQTSHEADDTWIAEHSRREPVCHAPVESREQYDRYVEEYDIKHEDYMQIHQAIRRTQRYVSAIEAGYQAAMTQHEEDWYNQQAERLGKRVHPLMQHWCSAYKVLHEELQDIKDRLEEYQQHCASEDRMADE